MKLDDERLRKLLVETLCGSRSRSGGASLFWKLSAMSVHENPFCAGTVDHGVAHWSRVFSFIRLLGYLSEGGMDIVLASVFAAMHDSQREDEGYDEWHGLRAADVLVASQSRGDLARAVKGRGIRYLSSLRLNCSSVHPEVIALAALACELHTTVTPETFEELAGRAKPEQRKQVALCIDGDRLDYGRLGVPINPAMLLTEEGKQLAAILNDINFG